MTAPPAFLALIVGGSSGMGKQTAKRLLRRGGEVWLVARHAARLAQAKAELEVDGPVQTTAVDLYDESQVDAFIKRVQQEPRHINYLVNTAGVFKPTPFLEHTKADYDKYLVLNRSLFFITQAVADNMKRHGGGAMVNIGSMWAKQAIKATPSSAYSMAKAGLHAMTQHLAMELADYHIRVNAVSPAVVVTPIYGEFIDPDKIEAFYTRGFVMKFKLQIFTQDNLEGNYVGRHYRFAVVDSDKSKSYPSNFYLYAAFSN